MSKSKSTHTLDKGCTPVTWTMTGRGKSRTFYVVAADGAAEGDRVAAVSGRGKVTYGRLAEYNGPTDDGRHRWTLEHDTARNADVDLILANKRAEEPDSTYWQSDAGRETAERIAARMLRAASKRAAKSEPEPEPVKSEPEPKSEPAGRAALVAETVAALVAAGASADVIAATVAALESPSEPAESKSPSPSPSKPRQSKPRKSPSKSKSPSPSETVETCDACNMPRKGCRPHAGAANLVTCPRCSTLDADTATRRAARHN